MLFYETGCRPRLACVEMLRRSSAVIQYRVSRHITWPVTESSADVVCSDEKFSEQRTSAGSPSSRQYRFLVSQEKYHSSTVACEIGAWFHINGSNSRGQQVEGFIDACGSDDNAFRYVTSSTVNDKVVTSLETHRCLATFTERIFPAEFTYIISAAGEVLNPAAPPRLFCWLLEKSASLANPRMYLTYAADCYRETAFETSSTNYLAEFDLVSFETGQEWIRNCSSSQQVPVVTPGLMTAHSSSSTPGLGSTTPVNSIRFSVTIDNDDSNARTLTANTAAVAAAATGITLMINLLR